MCEAKLAELQETVRLRRERGFSAASDVVLTDRGKEAMAQIVAVLEQMLAEENQLLAVRTENSTTVTRLLYQITGALFIVTAVLSILLLRLIFQVRKLQAGLVSVCAWTKQVRLHGEWVPVDTYLADRFGLNITHGISKKAAEKLLSETPVATDRHEQDSSTRT